MSNEWSRRNPAAGEADRRNARSVAEAAAHELARAGAVAVVLAGSWARGDARRASDVDLWAIGRDRPDVARWRPPFLVSIHRTSYAAERRRLREAPSVGGSVPAWREAIILFDPRGRAAALQDYARRFRWAAHAAAHRVWIDRQVAAWAEESTKLVRALATGERATAAVQRNLLAESLGFVMAIHRRQFWGSENEFWERIGRMVGGRWAIAQRAALGLHGASFERSCRAALQLYAETVRELGEALGAETRAIAENACAVSGARLGRRPARPPG